MFKKKKIKYIKISKNQSLFSSRKECLVIKYWGENGEGLLTDGKVDLEDFENKQWKFLKKGRDAMLKKANGWHDRHQAYLDKFAPK